MQSADSGLTAAACSAHSRTAGSKTDAKSQRIAAKSNQWLQRPRVRHRKRTDAGLTQLLPFLLLLLGSLVSYTTLASDSTSSRAVQRECALLSDLNQRH